MTRSSFTALAFAVSLLASSAPALAMDFACSKIENATTSDLAFKKICINDHFAILQTGSFEANYSLYKVTAGEKLLNSYAITLTAMTAKRFARPEVATIEAMVLKADGEKDLAQSLVGGSVMLQSGPVFRQAKQQFTAKRFETQDVELVL